jgi:hypothetical protein
MATASAIPTAAARRAAGEGLRKTGLVVKDESV